jgi:hypothetical protein
MSGDNAVGRSADPASPSRRPSGSFAGYGEARIKMVWQQVIHGRNRLAGNGALGVHDRPGPLAHRAHGEKHQSRRMQRFQSVYVVLTPADPS